MGPPRTNRSRGNITPKNIFQAITLGDEASVKDFVEFDAVPLKTLNRENQTPAHVAAQNGHLKLLKYLLRKDASVLNLVDHYGNNVLFWAIQNGSREMVEYLIDSYELKVSQPNKRFLGNCAIHVAAENGKLEILRYFLEEKYGDVDTRNDEGETSIFVAAERTQLDVIKYLVEERNANVTATNINDENVLYVCAKTGELAVPKYLLDERKIKFDINRRNVNGYTVTFAAARFNNLDLVKYFVEEKHADINIPDKSGKSAICEVASIGHFQMVKYLAKKGATFDLKDKILRKTAEKNILKYLKEIAKKRTRRSVPELFVSHPSPIHCGWIRRHYIDSRESKEVFSDVVRSRFDTLLALANVCVDFFNRSRYKLIEHQLLRSPPTLIRDRIDPFAVDAVNNKLFYFRFAK